MNTKTAERDRVVLENLQLVKTIAVRVRENLPVHLELDDLVHAGILGLFDAAQKYNSGKCVAFATYAKHRIKGAILDSLRKQDWASRDLRRRYRQMEAVIRDLSFELGRTPTDEEVAGRLGLDVKRWRQIIVDFRNIGLISADTRRNDQDDLPMPEFPAPPATQPDQICARHEMAGALGTAMRLLPKRYQTVVRLYYTNEMTMKQIGGFLGVNESRVSQIHKSALARMAQVLTASGIESTRAF